MKTCVLPELVGRYYTKMPSITATSEATNEDTSSNESENQEVVSNNNVDENQEASDNGSANDTVVTNTVVDTTDDNVSTNIESQWCYCKSDSSYVNMIACDNDACVIQ